MVNAHEGILILITITKWNETFENADTRKRQRLKSFHCPSGIESRGLVNLLCKTDDQQLALAAFGVFQLICQLSATLPADHRGRLIHSDSEPMTLAFLARLFRIDICHLTGTLELLAAHDVGWISLTEEKCNLPLPADNLPALFKEKEKEKVPATTTRGDGEPCIDGYPTKAQAIAAAGNQMIPAEVAERWWLSRDGQGWQGKNGNPMPPEAWQSNLKAFSEIWKANDARDKSKPRRGTIAANNPDEVVYEYGMKPAKYP